MNAKEYLEQIHTLESRIQMKTGLLENLNDMATRTTAAIHPVSVSQSRDVHERDGIYAKIADLKEELDRYLALYANLKLQAQDLIRMAKTEHRQLVLHHRYLEGWSYQKIAEEMFFSTRSIFRLLRIALNDLEVPEDAIRID